MNLSKTSTFVLISSIALAGGISLAQITPGGTPGASPTPTGTTSPTASPAESAPLAALNNGEVINYLHHVNNLEILQANAALAQAVGEQARSYAQQMITDHRQNEQQVTALAQEKGLTLYAFQPATFEVAVNSQLGTLSGQEYDQAYLAVQRQGHQKVLQDLQLMQAQVTDPDLQNLVTQTITVVQEHVDRASGGAGATPTPTPTPTPSVSPTPTGSPAVSG